MIPRPFAVLGLALTLVLPGTVEAGGFGTKLTGRIVYPEENPIPKPRMIPFPAEKTMVSSQALVVHSQNRGVKNTLVFLAKVDDRGRPDPKALLPIHPSLKKAKSDQEGVEFHKAQRVPRITVLREGQSLLVKNTEKRAHNFLLQGANIESPTANLFVPPKSEMKLVRPWKPQYRPSAVVDLIHRWIGGFVWILPHPYFAIEHPPAGTYQLIVWHETVGWIRGGQGGA